MVAVSLLGWAAPHSWPTRSPAWPPRPAGSFRLGQWADTEWGPVLADAAGWIGAGSSSAQRAPGWGLLVRGRGRARRRGSGRRRARTRPRPLPGGTARLDLHRRRALNWIRFLVRSGSQACWFRGLEDQAVATYGQDDITGQVLVPAHVVVAPAVPLVEGDGAVVSAQTPQDCLRETCVSQRRDPGRRAAACPTPAPQWSASTIDRVQVTERRPPLTEAGPGRRGRTRRRRRRRIRHEHAAPRGQAVVSGFEPTVGADAPGEPGTGPAAAPQSPAASPACGPERFPPASWTACRMDLLRACQNHAGRRSGPLASVP